MNKEAWKNHKNLKQAGAELGQAQPNWKWGLVWLSEISSSNTLVELVNLMSLYRYDKMSSL